jgi:inner membrane protein
VASLGHIAIGMAAARAYRGGQGRWPLIASMFAWSALSLLPDADVVGFKFGIRYADPWGHRGATHSFVFAIALGVLIGVLGVVFRLPPVRTALYAMLVLASHALLDALTDGGLGCALFWPFDNQRYFAPWNPIPVAPIGRAFFSRSGLYVASVELVMFLPFFAYAVWWRRARAQGGRP